MLNKKFWMLLSLMLVFALALAACGGGTTETAEEPVATEAAPAEEVAPVEEEAEPTAEEAPAETMDAGFAVMPGGALEEALTGALMAPPSP